MMSISIRRRRVRIASSSSASVTSVRERFVQVIEGEIALLLGQLDQFADARLRILRGGGRRQCEAQLRRERTLHRALLLERSWRAASWPVSRLSCASQVLSRCASRRAEPVWRFSSPQAGSKKCFLSAWPKLGAVRGIAAFRPASCPASPPPQRQSYLSSTRADESSENSRVASCRSTTCFCKLRQFTRARAAGSFIRPSAICSCRRMAACRRPVHQSFATAAPFGGIFCSNHDETSASSPGASLDMKALIEAGSSGRSSASRMRASISASGVCASTSRQFCVPAEIRAPPRRAKPAGKAWPTSWRGAGAGAAGRSPYRRVNRSRAGFREQRLEIRAPARQGARSPCSPPPRA